MTLIQQDYDLHIRFRYQRVQGYFLTISWDLQFLCFACHVVSIGENRPWIIEFYHRADKEMLKMCHLLFIFQQDCTQSNICQSTLGGRANREIVIIQLFYWIHWKETLTHNTAIWNMVLGYLLKISLSFDLFD